jgi:hypothetical protein
MPAVEDIQNELIDDIASFYYDPLGFVHYVFAWGSDELEEYDGPDEWQTKQLKRIGETLKDNPNATIQDAIASGHGIGKTAEVAWIILWAMSTRPNLAGWVTANTQNQLTKKTWRELAVWHNRLINKHWFKWTATRFYHVDYPETWGMDAIPWSEHNSEAFAGLHAENVLLIMDEASAIAEVIWDVANGAMTTPGAMWFVYGNPTRNTGSFRECFGAKKHRWTTQQVDSRTAKMTNKVKLNEWIEDYGEDSDFCRVRIKGEFPRAGSTQLISVDLVNEAINRETEYIDTDPLIMGVDVARFGDDQSVIQFRRGRDAKSIPIIKYRELDTMQLSARVVEFANKHHPDSIFIDEGSMGAGVIDRVRQLGWRCIGVQFGSKSPRNGRANMRAYMWSEMQEWLKTGAIQDVRDLKDDLMGVEYGYNASNQILLEKKEDMKKRGLASPDFGDALALTFAYPVGPRRSSKHGRRQVILDQDYDPFKR